MSEDEKLMEKLGDFIARKLLLMESRLTSIEDKISGSDAEPDPGENPSEEELDGYSRYIDVSASGTYSRYIDVSASGTYSRYIDVSASGTYSRYIE